MANKKYVPQGTYLACDKGTVPVEFMITNNNNAFLFDEPVANTGDMVPMLNVMPMGVCTVTGSACVPAPIMWDGFEDGIFVGFFNPLLEDSVLPCSVGGKIEIYYSLEEATAACAEEESSFWETLGKVVLVVAAVALIVVTGGAAAIAIGGMAAAASAGTLTVGAAILGGAGIIAEGAGIYFTAKALYDYSQDGDEEALFKEVALGFLFLGVGKVLAKGAKALKLDDIIFSADLSKVKGTSRSAHRNAANKQLHEAMKKNPKLRKKIEKYDPDAFKNTDNTIKPNNKTKTRKNPKDLEWDHNTNNPNQIDLRTKKNHARKTAKDPGRAGGYSKYYKNK